MMKYLSNKKLLLISITILLLFVACGSDDKQKKNEESSTTTTTFTRVLDDGKPNKDLFDLSVGLSNYNFFQGLAVTAGQAGDFRASVKNNFTVFLISDTKAAELPQELSLDSALASEMLNNHLIKGTYESDKLLKDSPIKAISGIELIFKKDGKKIKMSSPAFPGQSCTLKSPLKEFEVGKQNATNGIVYLAETCVFSPL
jgi:hypothetical protein